MLNVCVNRFCCSKRTHKQSHSKTDFVDNSHSLAVSFKNVKAQQKRNNTETTIIKLKTRGTLEKFDICSSRQQIDLLFSQFFKSRDEKFFFALRSRILQTSNIKVEELFFPALLI